MTVTETPPSNAVNWATDYVTFEAESIAIEANGRVFNGQGERFRIHSDPGTLQNRRTRASIIDITPSGQEILPGYTTLEVEWREHGVEMRLNLYFGAGDTHWWVTEIRHYDGTERGRWLYYRDIYFRTPHGEPFFGEVKLAAGPHNEPVGSLTIRNLRLTTAL